jgi:hypothetical protein
VALDKGRQVAGDVDVEWVCADATAWSRAQAHDLVVVAYLQLGPDQRRAAMRNAFASLRPGGTLLVVAHDSSNLTEGTGGPQDAAVLYTAGDVLDDLAGERFDVVRAERVTRVVPGPDGGSETALDCLVRLVRRG